MTNVIMYGIKNCDTIKKARKWLEADGIDSLFHDYKKDGIDEKRLTQWIALHGWEKLINKRGTTWRKLPNDIKDNINEQSAITIMLENTSIIKRPVLDTGSVILIGFSADEYAQQF